MIHTTQERKNARRDLRRLARAETEADRLEEEKLRQLEEAEMAALMKIKPSSTAQLSLAIAVEYLVKHCATRLPKECCQACKALAMPLDPKSIELIDRNAEMRPMRTFCGHWLHFKCLNEWLTTPPFIRQCPVCNRRIWHPDWPADHKILEKAYNNEQARKREMSDVADLFDLGSSFKR